MIRPHFFSVLAVLCLFLPAQPTYAQAGACDIKEVELQQPTALTYFPFRDRQQNGVLRLRVKTSGQCNLGVGIAGNARSSLQGPGGDLGITFLNARGQRLPASGTESRAVSFVPNGEFLEAVLTTQLRAQQVLRPGQYRNTFALRLYESGRNVNELDFSVNASVMPEADLKLAGNSQSRTGRAAGLNFGELRKDKALTALLSVNANSAYNLAVESENGGFLQHTNEQSELGKIPYSAWLDNQLLLLSNSGSNQRYDLPDSGQRVSKVLVKIGDTSNRRAGEYRDTLRVTVTILD
uniref:hypothetical protein n=1 Tax=Microbulbifer agarilyticus TaxID=260552 RepID=UPI000255AA60|nr:hypothetical protein [Microbulbifer agarilyticus]